MGISISNATCQSNELKYQLILYKFISKLVESYIPYRHNVCIFNYIYHIYYTIYKAILNLHKIKYTSTYEDVLPVISCLRDLLKIECIGAYYDVRAMRVLSYAHTHLSYTYLAIFTY